MPFTSDLTARSPVRAQLDTLPMEMEDQSGMDVEKREDDVDPTPTEVTPSPLPPKTLEETPEKARVCFGSIHIISWDLYMR